MFDDKIRTEMRISRIAHVEGCEAARTLAANQLEQVPVELSSAINPITLSLLETCKDALKAVLFELDKNLIRAQAELEAFWAWSKCRTTEENEDADV